MDRWVSSLMATVLIAACQSARDDTVTDEGGGLWNDGMTDGTDTEDTSGSTEGKPAGDTGGDAGNPCGEPVPGSFGDCVNINHVTCGNEDAVCLGNRLQDPDFGVCSKPCETACDCWDPPADGTAVPACAAISGRTENVCILDCAGDKVCPSGMRCSRVTAATAFCVFDRETDPSDDSGG